MVVNNIRSASAAFLVTTTVEFGSSLGWWYVHNVLSQLCERKKKKVGEGNENSIWTYIRTHDLLFLFSFSGTVLADCPADKSVSLTTSQNQPVCLCFSTYYSATPTAPCTEQAIQNGCSEKAAEALVTNQDLRVDALTFQDPDIVVCLCGLNVVVHHKCAIQKQLCWSFVFF